MKRFICATVIIFAQFLVVAFAFAETPTNEGGGGETTVFSAILQASITTVSALSLGFLAILTAIFLFALPYIDSRYEDPLTLHFERFGVKIDFSWIESVLAFVGFSVIVNVVAVIHEIYSPRWVLQFCRGLVILLASWAIILVYSAYKELPALVKRIDAQRELRSK